MSQDFTTSKIREHSTGILQETWAEAHEMRESL